MVKTVLPEDELELDELELEELEELELLEEDELEDEALELLLEEPFSPVPPQAVSTSRSIPSKTVLMFDLFIVCLCRSHCPGYKHANGGLQNTESTSRPGRFGSQMQ
ncbi:hypothetical protein DWB84_08650 [Saccharophagus sp. K07]|nr:hypothetical protein [Saccharophagus sp. K07]